MTERGWKKAERAFAEDVGAMRIPVTGERFGADWDTPAVAYQLKVRRGMPGYLLEWLEGIRAHGAPDGQIGAVVWKRAGRGFTRRDALVFVSWADWADRIAPAIAVADELRDANERAAELGLDLQVARRELQVARAELEAVRGVAVRELVAELAPVLSRAERQARKRQETAEAVAAIAPRAGAGRIGSDGSSVFRPAPPAERVEALEALTAAVPKGGE